MRRERLIDQLASDLAPVRRAPGAAWIATGWLAIGALTATALVLAVAPLRPGALAEIASSPRLDLELLAGLATGLAAVLAARALALVREPSWRVVGPPIAALLLWASLVALRIGSPTPAAARLAERSTCLFEIAGVALPLVLLGIVFVRRLAPIDRPWCGALVALAAGAIPALFMHVACTSEPWHVLGLHLAPLVALAALGALVGGLAFRRL